MAYLVLKVQRDLTALMVHLEERDREVKIGCSETVVLFVLPGLFFNDIFYRGFAKPCPVQMHFA